MSDGITMGDDEPASQGIEVPSDDLDPLGELVSWTNEVRALERASAAFPDLEAVVDDNGYFGPSLGALTIYGGCWLLCGTRANAVQVFGFLAEYADELDLIPDLDEGRALIYIHARKTDRP
jgi:hypothetical protein